jgi:hypothetical protein
MSGAIVVTAIGEAGGSKAAAAALACAGAEPDRPALLVDVGGPPPRPALVSSPGARDLERRLSLHRPGLRVAARGQTCHLAVADDTHLEEHLRAVLPLVRGSLAVLHLPPGTLREVLEDAAVEAAGVLLRADLDHDRALTALATADLIRRGLAVRVLDRPLAWIPARRALFGVLPGGAPGGLPERLLDRLLDVSSKTAEAAG